MIDTGKLAQSGKTLQILDIELDPWMPSSYKQAGVYYSPKACWYFLFDGVHIQGVAKGTFEAVFVEVDPKPTSVVDVDGILERKGRRKGYSMNNEPVAIRYDFDGYGYQYMDSGSGSDWQTRVDGELLYTHPAELTDEEMSIVCFALHRLIHSAYAKANEAGQDLGNKYSKIGDVAKFLKDAKTAESALAILRKASEK